MFSSLQVKTSYSILSSLNDIKKLVSLAKEYGYESLAITDNENMFGVMEFYLECKKNDIKPIIGLTLTLNETPILLYAKNELGYKNLIKLSTIVSDRKITIDDLREYSSNLIVIMNIDCYDDKITSLYEDYFIGYSKYEDIDKVNDMGVFINDVSYLRESDYKYLDYANMIRDGKVIGEYEFGKYKGKHLLKKDEYMSLTNKKVLDNIKYISDSCNLEIGYKAGLLPIYDKNINSSEYLRNLSMKGLKRRLDNKVPDELYFDFPIIILLSESQNNSPPTFNSHSLVPEEFNFTVL